MEVLILEGLEGNIIRENSGIRDVLRAQRNLRESEKKAP